MYSSTSLDKLYHQEKSFGDFWYRLLNLESKAVNLWYNVMMCEIEIIAGLKTKQKQKRQCNAFDRKMTEKWTVLSWLKDLNFSQETHNFFYYIFSLSLIWTKWIVHENKQTHENNRLSFPPRIPECFARFKFSVNPDIVYYRWNCKIIWRQWKTRKECQENTTGEKLRCKKLLLFNKKHFYQYERSVGTFFNSFY